MADREIVIKIPEEQYKYILMSDYSAFTGLASKEMMMHIIKNGTLLPEGHGRLIAEPTKEEIEKTVGGISEFADYGRDCVKAVLDNAPTIIPADTPTIIPTDTESGGEE